MHILDGFLAERQRTNRQRTLPHGFDQLQRSGALGNLRLAAGGDGRYQALADTSGATFPFLDSDVYKWLEAVGWELGRAADPGLAAAADQAIARGGGGPAPRRLPQQLRPGGQGRDALHATSPGATSSTASAT